ncbi:hypothetical protein [Paenibacillus sp. LHD-38]|uniref:hypothetical protein n=1 Tax=Paenibacillus sp. LHD-38 TaxID=3072143 RepID=UPI00280E0B74|nr:hypothetical protein [Paenibacillus sp. LHD-38]MDQ8738813.1 hypothetical protein [Paenibacillus sp. LHD-38]
MEGSDLVTVYIDLLQEKCCRFPNQLFVGEQGKKNLAYLTRYLIEEYLNIPIEDIPDRVSADILWRHRLRPPATVHGWNFIELVQHAYPGQFYAWEFRQVSNGYWKGEKGRQRAIEAIKYVSEEKCRIPYHEIPQCINYHFFKEHRIRGNFNLFGQSPYQVVDAVYPDQFQPWEFANVPMNCWKNAINIKQMMDCLLFEKLQFSSYQEAHKELKKRHFSQYRLTGFYQMAFDMRLLKAKHWIFDQVNSAGEIN